MNEIDFETASSYTWRCKPCDPGSENGDYSVVVIKERDIVE